MPPYLTEDGLPTWQGLIPLPFIALVITILLAFLYRWSVGKNQKSEDKVEGSRLHASNLFVLYAFALIGVVSGYFTGFSREPVVGAFLPAFLTLIGGFITYMVAKHAETRLHVALCVIALTLNANIGVGCGAVMRVAYEEAPFSEAALTRKIQIDAWHRQEELKLDISLKAQQAEAEFQVNRVRHQYGLAPLPAGWTSERPSVKE
jgi:hypothetical protein